MNVLKPWINLWTSVPTIGTKLVLEPKGKNLNCTQILFEGAIDSLACLYTSIQCQITRLLKEITMKSTQTGLDLNRYWWVLYKPVPLPPMTSYRRQWYQSTPDVKTIKMECLAGVNMTGISRNLSCSALLDKNPRFHRVAWTLKLLLDPKIQIQIKLTVYWSMGPTCHLVKSVNRSVWILKSMN